MQIQQVKLKLLLNLNERGETAGYTTWNPPEKFTVGDWNTDEVGGGGGRGLSTSSFYHFK